MSRTLAPIPAGVAITDKDGTITPFFRLLWQSLIDNAPVTPTRNSVARLSQTAAISTAAAYTTRTSGLYRISFYVRVTNPDGVSSAVQVTLGWTDGGVPLTQAFTNLTGDTTATYESAGLVVYSDALSDITYSTTYASNTPGTMAYQLFVPVEQL